MPRKPNIRINERLLEPTAGARVNVNAAGEGPSNLYGQPVYLSGAYDRRRGFQSPVGSPTSSLSGFSDDDFLALQASQRTAAVEGAAINFKKILGLYWQIIAEHSQNDSDFFNEAQKNLIEEYNGNNNLYNINIVSNPLTVHSDIIQHAATSRLLHVSNKNQELKKEDYPKKEGTLSKFMDGGTQFAQMGERNQTEKSFERALQIETQDPQKIDFATACYLDGAKFKKNLSITIDCGEPKSFENIKLAFEMAENTILSLIKCYNGVDLGKIPEYDPSQFTDDQLEELHRLKDKIHELSVTSQDIKSLVEAGTSIKEIDNFINRRVYLNMGGFGFNPSNNLGDEISARVKGETRCNEEQYTNFYTDLNSRYQSESSLRMR